jgi:Protein of unknown function (DUF3421)
MRRSVIVLIVGVLCAGGLQAQTRATQPAWTAAANGTIPPGAVAHGREADGREQFVCRAAYEGGTHLGKIASGFGGCNIGYGGREVTLPQYEVLAQQRVRRADLAVGAIAELLNGNGGERGQAAAAATQPAAPATPEVERGFDADGEPYVITRFPDGTIERRTPSGGTRTKPDGTQEKIPPLAYAHSPVGTPPELPADPKQGRFWMEQHNRELLSMISALVKNNESEMQKFNEAERKVQYRDLYDQIAYRTQVATFLAKGR